MLRQDMYAKGKEPLQKLLHVAPLTVSQIKHQYAFEVRRRVWCRVVRRWMGLNPLCPCVLHQVAVPGKKYFFRAPDAKQQKMWVDVLGAVLEKVREECNRMLSPPIVTTWRVRNSQVTTSRRLNHSVEVDRLQDRLPSCTQYLMTYSL